MSEVTVTETKQWICDGKGCGVRADLRVPNSAAQWVCLKATLLGAERTTMYELHVCPRCHARPLVEVMGAHGLDYVK